MANFDKKSFLDMLHHTYINKYINTNVHCHAAFFKMFKEICKEKKEQDILQRYDKIKRLLLDNEFEQAPEYVVGNGKRDEFIAQFSQEWPVLVSLKDAISPHAYSLLNVFYGYIVNHTNFQHICSCVQCILDMKPREFSKQTDVSAIAVLFNVLAYISKTMDSKDIYKFIAVSRELMFWKGTKKAMLDRCHSKLIWTCIFVMSTGNIDNTVPKIATGPTCKQKYLFVICEKDWRVTQEVDEIKHAKPKRAEVKNVKVSIHTSPNSRVDIIKKYADT